MTGAEAVLQTAAAAGVRVCFANPGTTEMALVNALDRVPSIRAVLGLFEGVCSGAADGYARMSGRPALTLLHLGPGLANALANPHNAGLYLGGHALSARGQLAAGRVAQATGCRLFSETFPARFERGAGLPQVDRLPYFPEWVASFLEGLRTLVLAATTEPVAFFGYPGIPSRLTPEGCAVLTLAAPEEDVEAALESLADAIGAPAAVPPPAEKPEAPEGELTAEAVGTVLALLQPEGAIVVDESATTGLGYFPAAASSPRPPLLTLTGGSIGLGPPCATGAAIACPDRTVINFQGDGGAMYTLQALWTQAREQLHVVTLICANRAYRILQIESARAGVPEPGPKALSLTELSRPPLDWVHLARGMGVPASRADSVDSLHRALSVALAEQGPHLIEVVV